MANKTKNALPDKAQAFVDKWSKINNSSEINDMNKEMLAVLEDAFAWGRISTAKIGKFTFEEWRKTNTH